MKEYVVTFPYCEQVSPNDWQLSHPAMKVTPETTMAEIELFFRRYVKNMILDVNIRELEPNNPQL